MNQDKTKIAVNEDMLEGAEVPFTIVSFWRLNHYLVCVILKLCALIVNWKWSIDVNQQRFSTDINFIFSPLDSGL